MTITGVLLLFCLCILNGQSLQEQDILLQPSQLLMQDLGGLGNDAYITQVGSVNDVELFQENDNQGEINLARILQSGKWNVALITQTEHGNQISLIQHGKKNFYELVNLGTGNELLAIQDGNGNRIVQQLIESDYIRSQLIQLGNNNEIMTVLEGMKDNNLTIKQIGDGLSVIIRQSSF